MTTRPLELELRLYRLMSGMLITMIDELSDEQMVHQIGDSNPPSWIVGHLAIGNDFGVATLGGRPQLIDRFMTVFGPGSPPVGDHPPKHELVQMFTDSRSRFVEAVAAATPQQLNRDRDSTILKTELPLVIDMVGHLLTSHLSMHIGQLSAWRRVQGMPSVLPL